MKKILLGLTAIIISASLATTFTINPAFAGECDGVETAIINCDGEEGIPHILNLVVEILSIGVGILGVVGISIVGIQYLTAGGNEEKTRKAKRRMFEIVIGLAVFVVFRAVLAWLGVG